jgi:hypothetical protein
MICEDCGNKDADYADEDAYGNVLWVCFDCGHYTLEDNSGGE